MNDREIWKSKVKNEMPFTTLPGPTRKVIEKKMAKDPTQTDVQNLKDRVEELENDIAKIKKYLNHENRRNRKQANQKVEDGNSDRQKTDNKQIS